MVARRFVDGPYWVQHAPGDDPQVARYDQGSWRLHGVDDPIETRDFHRIGRRVVSPADAFEDEIEEDGGLGV